MTAGHPDWIRPVWPVAACVRALITTRPGGVSAGPWGVPPAGRDGMNVGFLSGDAPEAVRQNRARLRAALPAEPRWLKQVHGATVVRADDVDAPVEADGAYTCSPGVVPVVMVADCMPVLLAAAGGRCVGAAHAGWRGVASGVIQATARAMRTALDDPHAELIAYLGPAIGRAHFEVGGEVLEAMQRELPRAADAFRPHGERFLADLSALARQALAQVGVERVYGGSACTFGDPGRYYSYRRDRVTGRHAALIWIAPAGEGSPPDRRQSGGSPV